MQPADKRAIAGVGGTRKAAGAVAMQALFKDLGVVIYVAFTVLDEQVPTLLSIMNMLKIGQDIYMYIYKGNSIFLAREAIS